MKKWKKITALILTFILFNALPNLTSSHNIYAAGKSTVMRDLTASDIVADMGLGWNLGNTLDSHAGYSNSRTNFQLVGYYMDKTNSVWNMSKSVFCTWKNASTIEGTLSWDMSSIKSTDDSLTSLIGFQLWNFNKELPANTSIKIKVTKAEFTSSKQTVSFPKLLGEHDVMMKENGVGQYGISSFDNELKKTSQLKEGTLTLSIEFSVPGKTLKSKEEYYETVWNNPLATEALFEQIKAGGFRAVRIPTTWNLHTDSAGTIDKAWMDRVEQVVNYALKNNLYCILNMHHDTGKANPDGAGWLKAEKDAEMSKRYAIIWNQIAERFKDYDDHLLFESFNEILTTDSKGNEIWGDPGQNALTVVNELNQLFVETVRATGGNNPKRHLVVNTYAASTAQGVLNGFILPNDTIKDHLIVQVHDYTPTDFAWYNDETNSKQRVTWGTDQDKADLNSIVNRLDNRFISKGIPVIIGEFDSDNKDNLSERMKHANYYVSAAASKGIVCFWWDSGGKFDVPADSIYKGPGLINRSTLQWTFPDLLNTMKDAAFQGKTFITAPGKATIRKISSKTSSVTISWDEVNTASGYQVSYSSSKNGLFQIADKIKETKFTIKGLKKGKTYYFKVNAYITSNDKTEFGIDSNIKSIKIK